MLKLKNKLSELEKTLIETSTELNCLKSYFYKISKNHIDYQKSKLKILDLEYLKNVTSQRINSIKNLLEC